MATERQSRRGYTHNGEVQGSSGGVVGRRAGGGRECWRKALV